MFFVWQKTKHHSGVEMMRLQVETCGFA